MLSENDIKEELSYVYAHALAAQLGYSMERIIKDRDSIDISVCARGRLDSNSILLSPKLDLQLKATSQKFEEEEFPFCLSMKNYIDLSAHTMVPRILIVLVLPNDTETWINCKQEHLILKGQAYWKNLRGSEESANRTTKTISMSKKNIFNEITLKRLMIAASKREDLQ